MRGVRAGSLCVYAQNHEPIKLCRARSRVLILTVSGHAEREALLQPAELAPVPVDPVHHAVLLARALVVHHGALAAAEEALAALAGDHAVVHPARLVAAHLARDDLDLGCNTKREGRRQLSSILRNSDEYLDCALDQILTPSRHNYG